MAESAVIFPGQGAQVVGMGHDVCQTSSKARAVFERANELLGFDLTRLCFEGPAEELEKTDIQQPAIFVTSVALWEAFLEAGGHPEQFSRTGGLSLGEYTALYVAGAFSFDDAVRVVRRRGELMQAAAVASPSGMVSLIGADERAANDLCDKARGPDILAPANFNCPGQIVIAGHQTACDRAVAMAETLDCRAIPLRVAGAFHSPLMASAADGLATVLTDVEVGTPRIPVIANVDATYHGNPEAIRDSLFRQVTHPVRWQRCIERMISDGSDRIIEVGPGRVLTGMMRKIDRKTPALNISSADAIASALSEMVSTD